MPNKAASSIWTETQKVKSGEYCRPNKAASSIWTETFSFFSSFMLLWPNKAASSIWTETKIFINQY